MVQLLARTVAHKEQSELLLGSWLLPLLLRRGFGGGGVSPGGYWGRVRVFSLRLLSFKRRRSCSEPSWRGLGQDSLLDWARSPLNGRRRPCDRWVIILESVLTHSWAWKWLKTSNFSSPLTNSPPDAWFGDTGDLLEVVEENAWLGPPPDTCCWPTQAGDPEPEKVFCFLFREKWSVNSFCESVLVTWVSWRPDLDWRRSGLLPSLLRFRLADSGTSPVSKDWENFIQRRVIINLKAAEIWSRKPHF